MLGITMLHTFLAQMLLTVAVSTPAEELYSDEWVRGMARMEIDSDVDSRSLDVPCLDIVPAGATLRISKIFNRLHIDVRRLQARPKWGINMVEMLEWRISQTHAITIMTATNDGADHSEGKEMDLEGYGVRIIRVK